MKKLFTLLGIFLCIVLATPAHAVTELIRSGTATPIPFLLVDAATGQIGQTGQASNCTVTVCKPGTTSYIASSGTITELGNGLYNYAPTTTETGAGTAFGFLLIHVTDSPGSCQVVDVSTQIVAFNPNDATAMGLSNIASSAIATDTQTGLTAQGYTTTLASNLITTNTDVPLIYTQTSATNQQSNVQAGMTSQGYTVTIAGNLITSTTTIDGAISYLTELKDLISYMKGKATNSVSVNDLLTTYLLQDGATTAFTNTTHYSSPPTAPAGRN